MRGHLFSLKWVEGYGRMGVLYLQQLCSGDCLKMTELFANSGDPDQKPHSMQHLVWVHCFPIPLLGSAKMD